METFKKQKWVKVLLKKTGGMRQRRNVFLLMYLEEDVKNFWAQQCHTLKPINETKPYEMNQFQLSFKKVSLFFLFAFFFFVFLIFLHNCRQVKRKKKLNWKRNKLLTITVKNSLIYGLFLSFFFFVFCNVVKNHKK